MANNNLYGQFLPTTFVWDVSQIYDVDVSSIEFKELIVRLHEFVGSIAYTTNLKDTGQYVLDEFVNGQQFFANPTSTSNQLRQDYRKAFIFGPLPNAGTLSIPHGIPFNSGFTITRFYGTASDTTGLHYIPLPYVSLGGNHVQINADGTNINVTTGIDYTAYNIAYIVIEYLKQ
jgi:hypothetical protein